MGDVRLTKRLSRYRATATFNLNTSPVSVPALIQLALWRQRGLATRRGWVDGDLCRLWDRQSLPESSLSTGFVSDGFGTGNAGQSAHFAGLVSTASTRILLPIWRSQSGGKSGSARCRSYLRPHREWAWIFVSIGRFVWVRCQLPVFGPRILEALRTRQGRQ